MGDLAADDRLLAAGRGGPAQRHHLERGLDRRQRVAQLVAEHGKEVVLGPAGLLGALLLGGELGQQAADLALRAHSLGAVGHGADHADRLAGLVAIDAPARQHPALLAVGQVNPVLDLAQLRPDRVEDRRAALAHPLAVLRVHAGDEHLEGDARAPRHSQELVAALRQHHLVDGRGVVPDAELAGVERESQPILGVAPRALGAAAIADVGHEAAQLDQRAGGVAHQLDLVADPDDRAVRSHHAVLELVVATRSPGLGARRGAAIAVVRVQVRGPEAASIRAPGRHRVAEQPLRRRADEEKSLGFRVRLPDDLVREDVQELAWGAGRSLRAPGRIGGTDLGHGNSTGWVRGLLSEAPPSNHAPLAAAR